jgi:hypothetical protein
MRILADPNPDQKWLEKKVPASRYTFSTVHGMVPYYNSSRAKIILYESAEFELQNIIPIKQTGLRTYVTSYRWSRIFWLYPAKQYGAHNLADL